MTYQTNAIPQPIASEEPAPAPLPTGWTPLDGMRADGALPPYDEHLRVLVYTGGSEFNGEQVFDRRATDFYALEESDEVIEAATHWMVRPAPEYQHADDRAVDRFAEIMKGKLALARAKGRGGWQACSPDMLSAMLREHVAKGDPVDVANFAMMLALLGSEIRPAEAANDPRAAEDDPTPTADDLATVLRPFRALPVRDDMKRADCTCEACMPNGNPFEGGMMRMIVCSTCGNKRCPHATDHRHVCTNSNDPGQPGSSYAHVRPLATIAEIAKARL